MKVLTKEEEQAHYNATLQGGLLGGLCGVAAGSLGVWGASARYPAFRGVTLPFRAFLIASTSTFSAIVTADSWSRRYETARQPERNYKDEQSQLQSQIDAQKSGKQRTMDWLQDNRYSIVFGSWVASMGAALGIVGRSPYLTTQQKIVQARVYAQGFTVAAVIASLAFEGGDRMSKTGRWETVKILDPKDPTHKHMIEKKIHHERYAGEDQWMDMVEAEEKRMKERENSVKQKEDDDKKSGEAKKDTKEHADKLEKGKPEKSKEDKLNAA